MLVYKQSDHAVTAAKHLRKKQADNTADDENKRHFDVIRDFFDAFVNALHFKHNNIVKHAAESCDNAHQNE